ncbi:MAG: GGDEF domain-containing protein, partial [Candidatus Electrothrix sp. EH2]|nr:GGDEF domain-containing protein [Candidatus Electrothrix sp. EH2]
PESSYSCLERKMVSVRLAEPGERAEHFGIRHTGDTGSLNEEICRVKKSEYQDSSTGIANRASFDRQFNRAWQHAQQTETPLSLLFCAIDNFTRFKEHYGSSAAHACLGQVADCLMTTLPCPTDLVARYEKEKFAILLPRTDISDALITADRLLVAVRSLAIPHEQSDAARVVTVSIGGHSLHPTLNSSVRTIIRFAEIRLFQAAHCGKNQSRLSTSCRDILAGAG